MSFIIILRFIYKNTVVNLRNMRYEKEEKIKTQLIIFEVVIVSFSYILEGIDAGGN